ncbi:ABC-type transport system, involved in lipoprotein release, permease component [Desulfitobacterium dehalogenans ATCC 51507]|uniref:ABC-type transport system, involved in lipoprotein release, permease component n=1 Tax=Desulfitobacterium dehalogenans (strain ATCC 51507 / DSM 9161 / JW/IU-DC1) TaxID=756499 RepID=I4A3I5_DESDJ|nr:FtsX-like permease family protein [Desulfitobacterium dehalogenans]AFL98519.1 ABC-type transport system, involved in lipoprotein release, permease component [Desulfitobacterium dehalogenans ATCC 51507]
MWFIAWENVMRRKGQSILTVLITGLTVLTFVLAFSVLFTLQEGLKLSNDRLGADIIVLPNKSNADAFQTIFTAEPVNIYMNQDITQQIAQVKGIEQLTSQFFTQTLDQSCCSIGGATRLVGYDPATDFILKPWLNEHNLTNLEDNQIIIGGNIPAFLGNQASVLGGVFSVVGNLYPTGSGMDETLFMNINVARQLAQDSPYLLGLWKKESPEKLISAILIKISEGYKPAQVAEDINNLGLAVEAVATSEVVSSMRSQILIVTKLILGLWLAVFFVACLALIGRFSALARERKKEIGLLRAIGVQRTEVFRLILLEAWLMAGAGGIAGSILGALGVSSILTTLRSSMGLPMGQWSWSSALGSGVLGIFVALLLGFVGSVYPAWKSSRLDPQEAIARGEVD